MRRILVLSLLGCSASPVSHDGGAEAHVGDGPARDSVIQPDGNVPSDSRAPVMGDAGDAGALFAGCPGPEAYVGNAGWRDALVLGARVQRCAWWVETDGSIDKSSTVNALKKTLARKVMAGIAAGTYKLPDLQTEVAFALPVCLVRPDGPPLATGTGTVTRSMFASANVFQLALPVTGMGQVRVSLQKEGPSPLTIDGIAALQHCPDGKCDPGVGIYFERCFVGGDMLRHTVSFEGGSVELISTIERGGISAGTEAGDFHRGSGTYRRTAFDQRDYFKLIYSPEHHHFTRNYAVLFDAPIAGACGLEIINLPGDQKPVHVYAVDCQLARQSELKVTGVKVE